MPRSLTQAFLIATMLVLATPSLFAVSQEVESGFKLQYPGEEVTSWNLNSLGYWEATFQREGVAHRAEFTARGEWVSTENAIEVSELPEKVREAAEAVFKGRPISEVEAIDHVMHEKLYEIWIDLEGKMQSTIFRENGDQFSAALTLRDPQKRYEVMETGQLIRDLGFNLVTILIFAWLIYYRRYHDHEMLFLLLGFNLFLFPIFLVSNNLTAGIGFTIFALLALVRLRSDPFTKAEIAYLLGAVALTFINAQLADRPQWISACMVLITAWVADHPGLWRDGYHKVNIRYRMKKTAAMLDEKSLRARVSKDYHVEVTGLKILSVQSEEVRMNIIYRKLPGVKPKLMDSEPKAELPLS